LKGKNYVIVTRLLFPHFGGVCTYLLQEINYFLKKGDNIYFVYSYLEKDSENKSSVGTLKHRNLHMRGLPGYNAGIRVLVDRMRRITLIRKLGKTTEVSCFHAHDHHSALTCVLAGYGNKTILHLHGTLSKEELELVPFHLLSAVSVVKKMIRYVVATFLEALTFNLVRGIVCVSEYTMKDALRKTLAKKKVMIHRLAVDPSLFKPKPEERKRLRQKMLIPSDIVVCMYLGRLAATHGPLHIARSIPYVNRETMKALFVFVGDGDERDRIVNYIKGQRLSNVVFLNEMPSEDVLPVADILIDDVSSLYEGYGFTMLEAMASGIPVISGRDSIKENAFVEKENIIFCRKDDPKDIADKVLKLIYDPVKRKELSVNSQKWVYSHYSLRKNMERLERILSSV
jgi:glycosyltransferase involved in cell wall biosynthesis